MFSLIVMSLILAWPSWAVFRVGNGGDSIAAEFVYEADDVLHLLEELEARQPEDIPSGFRLTELKKKIKTAEVFTQEKTFLANGQEVDALNFPKENIIILSRSRWRSVAFNLRNMRLLILHEYLGLISSADRSYEISSFFG